MEEALHDMPVYREFAKLDGVLDRLPDESTILRFRHLLEKHGVRFEACCARLRCGRLIC